MTAAQAPHRWPRALRLPGIPWSRAALERTTLRLLAAAAVTIGLAAALVGTEQAWSGRVLPGVRVGGVDLSGMTAEDARAALVSRFDRPHRLVLVSDGHRLEVDAAAAGRTVEVDAAVARAMAEGRGNGPLGDAVARARLLVSGVDLPLDIALDERPLVALLQAFGTTVAEPVRDAAIVATATGWRVTRPATGRELDLAASVAAVRRAVAAPGHVIVLPVREVAPAVDATTASLAIWEARQMAADVRLTLGDESWTLGASGLRWSIVFVPRDGKPAPALNRAMLERAVARLAPDIRVEPRETTFLERGNGTAIGFIAGRPGRALDVARTAAGVSALLERRRSGTVDPGEPVPVLVTPVQPRITPEEAAGVAPRMVRISTWTTRYVVGERNGYGANITIPARILDGTVLMPGEVFDFWRAIGPVTRERGFRPGAVIQGGRSNPTGALGGGICAVSSTLFNAAARGGYAILERHPHYYYISRYPLGLDATVSKSGGSTQNLRFRNDTAAPLYISGHAGPGWIRFEIFSVPTGRTVTIGRAVVTNVDRADDDVRETDALREGTTKRLEVPTDGMDVVVTRVVRDADGTVLHRDRFVSHYRRVDGILLVGTG